VLCKTETRSWFILTASSDSDTYVFTFTFHQIIAADPNVPTLAGNKIGRASKSSCDDSSGSEDGDMRIHGEYRMIWVQDMKSCGELIVEVGGGYLVAITAVYVFL
jgi:hypothetical protein